jgi:hypothetical protein
MLKIKGWVTCTCRRGLPRMSLVWVIDWNTLLMMLWETFNVIKPTNHTCLNSAQIAWSNSHGEAGGLGKPMPSSTNLAFSPRKWLNKKTNSIPSESAPQELSIYFDNLNFLGNFCVRPLVTEVTIRHLGVKALRIFSRIRKDTSSRFIQEMYSGGILQSLHCYFVEAYPLYHSELQQ